MSQYNPIIGANLSGLVYRQKDNDGKQALLNHHKGSTAPDYAEAGMIWLDDTATPWVLKIHDGADWIAMGSVNATTNTFEPYHGTALSSYVPYATDTGSTDAYAIAPVPAITAYAAGQIFLLKPANANTGAATIAVSGLSAKTLKNADGSDLSAGQLSTTGVYMMMYDGTNMVLMSGGAMGSPGGVGWSVITTVSATSVAAIEFITDIGTYDEYIIKAYDLTFSAGGASMVMRVSDDGGSTWKNGASDYWWVYYGAISTSTAYATGSQADSSMGVMVNVPDASGESGVVNVMFFNPANSSIKKQFSWQATYPLGNTNKVSISGGGSYQGLTSAIDAVQFLMTSGTVTGEFVLMGRNYA